ncbi:hypothetical protein KGV52_00005 [Candidatus Gracilibacteria bacterium]|nr:hypothetical protein [Candidatus Gracilibacteria bacterium]
MGGPKHNETVVGESVLEKGKGDTLKTQETGETSGDTIGIFGRKIDRLEHLQKMKH